MPSICNQKKLQEAHGYIQMLPKMAYLAYEQNGIRTVELSEL